MEDEWAPDEPWIENENFYTIILDKVSIVDILDKYNLEYDGCSGSGFDVKMKCPFHADGDERTASFFASAETNSFYCYSCNVSGSPIDFVMKYKGKPFHGALKEICELFNITGDFSNISIQPVKRRDPKETVIFHLYLAGKEIRDFIKTVDSKDKWKWEDFAIRQFKKMDKMMDILSDTEWEKAQQYRKEVSAHLGKN